MLTLTQNEIHLLKLGLQTLTRELTSKGELDLAIINRALSNMSYILDVDMGKETLKIERRSESLKRLSDYLHNMNKYELKS